MVPQIIFIILQVLAVSVTFAGYAKNKDWKGFRWYMFGIILTNAILIWGGFYLPLIQ